MGPSAVEDGLDLALKLGQACGQCGLGLVGLFERAGDRVGSIGAPIGQPGRSVRLAIGRSEIERHGGQHRADQVGRHRPFSSRETCRACQAPFPEGVLMPRASSALAMPDNEFTPAA